MRHQLRYTSEFANPLIMLYRALAAMLTFLSLSRACSVTIINHPDGPLASMTRTYVAILARLLGLAKMSYRFSHT
jgi:hypothetical protein